MTCQAKNIYTPALKDNVCRLCANAFTQQLPLLLLLPVTIILFAERSALSSVPWPPFSVWPQRGAVTFSRSRSSRGNLP